MQPNNYVRLVIIIITHYVSTNFRAVYLGKWLYEVIMRGAPFPQESVSFHAQNKTKRLQ